MALIAGPLVFTERDFESGLEKIQDEIALKFPNWTDFAEASFGNTILRLFAYVLDVLNFYLNNQVNECFMATVRRRRNMILLAELISQSLLTASAATVALTFSVASPAVLDIIIPAGTLVRTVGEEPLEFQTLAVATILSTTTSIETDAEHSESQLDNATADGASNQRIALVRAPFLGGSAVVDVSGQAGYSEVQDFGESLPADRHFTIKVDENDRGTVRFGDGTNGEVPVNLAAVTVDYKTGGGEEGNVTPDTITDLQASLQDIGGNPVTVTVTNPLRANNGSDRETVAAARLRLPRTVQAGNRTVTTSDFQVNAEGVAGVARLLAVGSTEEPAVSANEVKIIVIPDGGGLPTAALKAAVVNQVTVVKPSLTSVAVEALDPIFNVIDVSATIFLTTGAVAATVKAALILAMNLFFKADNADGTPNTKVSFGSSKGDVEVAPSKLITEMEGVDGVNSVQLATFIPAQPVEIGFREFPELGVLTLINGDTAAPL